MGSVCLLKAGRDAEYTTEVAYIFTEDDDVGDLLQQKGKGRDEGSNHVHIRKAIT